MLGRSEVNLQKSPENKLACNLTAKSTKFIMQSGNKKERSPSYINISSQCDRSMAEIQI